MAGLQLECVILRDTKQGLGGVLMAKKILVGTYTKKQSEGVYELTLDTEKQTLADLTLVAKAGNPTYLALSKAGRGYAIDAESDNGEAVGGLKVFDATVRPFKELQTALAPGTSPAYVSIDEARQLVYTANYHMGTVTVYRIQEDGTLIQVDQIKHSGGGPRPEQQDGPHPHYADLTPDGRLVVCDLGNDTVYIYNVSDDGHLEENHRFNCARGFGPRHIVFNPTTNMAYMVGELASKVAVLAYDSNDGSLTLQQGLSTIPRDWTAHNGAAAVRLSADGRFVYVSNRGYNSIAVFAVDESGTLNLIDNTPTEGDFPRDFNWDAEERFVVVVNQNTDNATLFSRDEKTGKLTKLQHDFAVPEGVCVVFED